MPELQIGGKTVATQTGTDDPVINSATTFAGTVSSSATFPAGHIVQVKHFDIGDITITNFTTADTWTDITSNSITTKVDNSYIFIMADIHVYIDSHSDNNWSAVNFRFLRGTSQIWVSNNNSNAHDGYTYGRYTTDNSDREMNLVNMRYLDTGNTNDAGTTINYDVEFSNRNGYPLYFNNSYSKSWVTLMEIVP